jgi:hypothetical protein
LESEVHHPVKNYAFGQICFWVNGKQLGNYEQMIILSPIADYLRTTLCYQGERQDETLINILPEQALNIIYSALYGDDNNVENNQDKNQQWKQYSKFCICPNGCESFDGELAVLLEDCEGEIFIWRDYYDRKVYEMRLEADEYESTVQAFLDWVNPLTDYQIK